MNVLSILLLFISSNVNYSQVTKVSEEAVMSKEAYLLFYLRKDTPWFSSQEVLNYANKVELSTQATASKKGVIILVYCNSVTLCKIKL